MTDFTADLTFPVDIENVELLNGYTLILPHEKERSQLITVPERWKHVSFRGVVIHVADGVDNIRAGMDVLFSPYAHRSVDVNGQLLFLIHCSDISAVLKAKG
jgi:co-chaperonin GroES (HSP10)